MEVVVGGEKREKNKVRVTMPIAEYLDETGTISPYAYYKARQSGMDCLTTFWVSVALPAGERRRRSAVQNRLSPVR